MSAIYVSPIGLSIFDDKKEFGHFTITGNPKRNETIVEFESAYDFEEFIQDKIKCDAIEFDSEFCQFFAYAKTKVQALSFVTRIEKHFDEVKKMLE